MKVDLMILRQLSQRANWSPSLSCLFLVATRYRGLRDGYGSCSGRLVESVELPDPASSGRSLIEKIVSSMTGVKVQPT
jgi:hypothetical protein